jgi:YidC/Oxa1 family membrane protein insertase
VEIIRTIGEPLIIVVSWVLRTFHSFFTALGLKPDGGLAWGLSIVGLVVIIRIILVPLFVKQIKAQRGMQELQPQIREIQKKYKNDRERQSQELMKLYKETGTNPLASCLPILVQAPFFSALFFVLNRGVAEGSKYGVISEELAQQAKQAKIFGAPIATRFTSSGINLLGASSTTVKSVTVVLILLMSLTTFLTQRQLTRKNMSTEAMVGPFAQQQKILLYVFPVMFAIFGINFPIGVLIYWMTTNIWTMGQQFYVIRNMPNPGTEAAEEQERRRLAKQERQDERARSASATKEPTDNSLDQDSPDDPAQEGPRQSRQRQQPKRAGRARRATPPRNSAKPDRRNTGPEDLQ